MNGWIHIYKQTHITILDSTNKQKKISLFKPQRALLNQFIHSVYMFVWKSQSVHTNTLSNRLCRSDNQQKKSNDDKIEIEKTTTKFTNRDRVKKNLVTKQKKTKLLVWNIDFFSLFMNLMNSIEFESIESRKFYFFLASNYFESLHE